MDIKLAHPSPFHARYKGSRAPCECQVKKPEMLPGYTPRNGGPPVPARETPEWMRRVYRNKLQGLPPEQCGWPAVYLVDDVPMCRNHAGQAAIEHIVEMNLNGE